MRPTRQEMELGLPIASPSEMSRNPVPREVLCPEPQPHLPADHPGIGLCRGSDAAVWGRGGDTLIANSTRTCRQSWRSALPSALPQFCRRRALTDVAA